MTNGHVTSQSLATLIEHYSTLPTQNLQGPNMPHMLGKNLSMEQKHNMHLMQTHPQPLMLPTPNVSKKFWAR
jgi:hypothetical protein